LIAKQYGSTDQGMAADKKGKKYPGSKEISE
jgi:hypothetical protein